MSDRTATAEPTATIDDPSSGEIKYVVSTIVAGVFVGGLGAGVAYPTLPALGPILGFSPLVVGAILSINRFSRLVMNTPAGQVLDRVGTRRPMILGFFVQGVVPFGYILGLHADALPLSSAAIFLVSRLCWGIGSAFVFVGAFTIITHVTNTENRGKWIGFMRGGQSLGFPAGLVVGGLMTDFYGYTEAFLVAGTVGLVAPLVALVYLPDVRSDVEHGGTLRELPAIVGADRSILVVGTVNFVVRMLFTGVLLSTVVLYATVHDISLGSLSGSGSSGIVMAVCVVCSGLTTLVVGNASDALENRALLTVPALLVLGSGFTLLAVYPVLFAALVGVAFVGVGVGGSNPPLLAYLGDISPDADTGKVAGLYNAFGDFGSTIGPLLALPFAARVGIDTEYLASAVLVVLTCVLVLVTLFGENAGKPPSDSG